jgi:hypothetical protein
LVLDGTTAANSYAVRINQMYRRRMSACCDNPAKLIGEQSERRSTESFRSFSRRYFNTTYKPLKMRSWQTVICLHPEREENTKCGVYRSVCLGFEIVLPTGAEFPVCPNHVKLTTRMVSQLVSNLSKLVAKCVTTDIRKFISPTTYIDAALPPGQPC